ncbi:MAG: threonine/serine dehydratase [Vicinamibacterales bacterium]
MITRDDIRLTYRTILPFIRTTPVVAARGGDFELGPFALTFKLELLQHAGSFKTRGAFANLLLRDVPDAGVAAASGGNHGAAVAFAAMRRGVRARIFVPEVSSPAKQERIRRYGAELIVTGSRYADALEACDRFVRESGALSIHAFDSRETLLGQGSVALELAEQAPEVETLLVAVGGGGLIGGIAAWCASRIRVVAVEPEGAPTLAMALEAGEPVDAPAGGIAADSLAPRRVGSLMFPIARQHVDRVVLVSDEAIREAQRRIWDGLRVVTEPGAAAAMAALVCRAYVPSPDERVAVLVSGGNTSAVHFR